MAIADGRRGLRSGEWRQRQQMADKKALYSLCLLFAFTKATKPQSKKQKQKQS
jgi:hypothetical protein